MDPKLDLKKILELHSKWLRSEPGGVRADLSSANLSSANLSSADLRYADLRSADLRYADLSSADLSSADLSYADLRYADLRSANLSSANLSSADLRYANLRSADLKDCKESELALAIASHIPAEGSFVGWKKCENGVLVKLLIPNDAKRSHGASRKCRASKVKVIEVIGAEVGISLHDGKTEYKKGKIVKPNSWCEDRWETCADGIHFYLTKEEAQAHV